MAIVKVAGVFGQSQVDGRIPIAQLPVDVTNPSSIVKFYAQGAWNNFDCTATYPSFADTPNYGFDTVLLNRLATNLGQTVYFVKNSRGATAFDYNGNLSTGEWRVGKIAPDDHYWKFIRRLKSTKAFIEYNGDTMEMPFLLPSIGYTDSQFSNLTDFKANFTAFVNEVKSIVGNPNLPIIWAQFKNTQGSLGAFIIQAQAELAVEIPNMSLLTSPQTYLDTIHYDAATASNIANEALPIITPLY